MSNETARAAINEALDNALDGELVEVSPTEHEIWCPGLDAELSRLLGSSIAMVDRHYGHLPATLRTRSGASRVFWR
jgi:hypothetical protein